MLIGVIKETKEFEHRVALSPDAVKLLKKKEFEVIIESGAGQSSYFSDEDYLDAGARVGSPSEVFQADLLLKVNLFTLEEIAQMKDKAACISFYVCLSASSSHRRIQCEVYYFHINGCGTKDFPSPKNGCAFFPSQFGRIQSGAFRS